jgi:hypothetical protein
MSVDVSVSECDCDCDCFECGISTHLVVLCDDCYSELMECFSTTSIHFTVNVKMLFAPLHATKIELPDVILLYTSNFTNTHTHTRVLLLTDKTVRSSSSSSSSINTAL